MQEERWDTRYEWRAVLLLTLAFGLVGLDRFAINPLFPAMMKDLGLNYQDLGNASAVLALAWGAASIVVGPLSDRLGRRKMVIPSVVVFSLMAGTTGLVTGVGALLAMRVVMGLAEGAFMPGSIAATVEASKPSRRGFNFGLQQNGLALVGLAIGPIIITQLLVLTGSWRLAFGLVAVPGIVVAFLLFKVLRDTQGTTGDVDANAHAEPAGAWGHLFRYRNVVLACLNMIGMAAGLNVVIVMTPSYLVDYLKVAPEKMGFIMSGFGLGALVIGTLLPALSDRLGRKPVMLAAALAAGTAVWAFTHTPADPVRLFLLLSAIAGFGFSVIYINNGPFTMESVPAPIASSAVGLVVGAGEIIGGTGAPAAAGYLAQHNGIQTVFGLSIAAMLASAVILLFVREPARARAASARPVPAE